MNKLISLFLATLIFASCKKEEALYIGSDWTCFPKWPQGEWIPNPDAPDTTLSTAPSGAKPGVRFLYRDANLDLFILDWNGDVLHEQTGALREEIRQMHLDYEKYLARREAESSTTGARSTGTTDAYQTNYSGTGSSSGSGYQSQVTPEMARTVASAVYQHSLSQNRVQVRGHMRENTYIEPYSRTPAGGYSEGDHFEAGAKGAAAAGAMMLVDWAAQKLEESDSR